MIVEYLNRNDAIREETAMAMLNTVEIWKYEGTEIGSGNQMRSRQYVRWHVRRDGDVVETFDLLRDAKQYARQVLRADIVKVVR
jgi:hypothetical protein